MKLWKENKLDHEWAMPNLKIAEEFLKSDWNDNDLKEHKGLEYALVLFISEAKGLNSSWEWNKAEGSIKGSKDMIEILNIIDKLETKLQEENPFLE